jgi:aromatic ring-opening dioxygenase LigB subunit
LYVHIPYVERFAKTYSSTWASVKVLVMRVPLVFVVLGCLGIARAEVVSVIVLPHGGTLLDLSQATTPEGSAAAEALSIGALATGQDALASKPELVVIITPHGFSDEESILLYGTPTAQGSWGNFHASLHVDTETTHELSSYLNQHSYPTRLLHSKDIHEPILLKWAEVIPWVLLGSPTDTPALIISMPGRWYAETSKQAPELLRFGQLLHSFLRGPEQPRTLLVASADLAHTHDCQHESFGCSPDAKPFEDAVQDWVKNQAFNLLLEDAGSREQQAQTCGYAQFLIIHGLLEAVQEAHGETAKGTVVAHGAPTYFGMMVAKWDLPSNTSSSADYADAAFGYVSAASAAGEHDNWSLQEDLHDGYGDDMELSHFSAKHWLQADGEDIGHYADLDLDLNVHYEEEGADVPVSISR